MSAIFVSCTQICRLMPLTAASARLLHVSQVRNKAISKRETEKTIKEIWKEKMAETRLGKQTDLAEFMFNFFQKRLGISTAVIEVRSGPGHVKPDLMFAIFLKARITAAHADNVGHAAACT